MILWGMGISQHVHGTDNARCLIALVTVTGQIGKPGSGLHPLRGQNNVQGASDAGLIPMMFPNYQRVDNAGSACVVRAVLGHAARRGQPGYTVVEIMHKALAPDDDPHKIRGMYIMGENPAMSDPDLNHARHALASSGAPGGAGHLHDRDRLAGRRGAARQRLAREDRHGEQHRPHGAARQAGARSAGRRQARPLDHPADRATHGPGLELRRRGKRRGRGLRGNAPGHACRHQRHHLGAAAARVERDLSVPERGRSGPADRVHRPLPDRRRPREAGAGRHHPGRRAARCRLPVRADHRPPARALAHRQHDAPRERARCAGADGDGLDEPGRPGRDGAGAGRRDHGPVAPRRGGDPRAARRRHAARGGVRAVRLLRGGGQPDDQRRARPLRQDPGVQVLRGAHRARRPADGGRGLRNRRNGDNPPHPWTAST